MSVLRIKNEQGEWEKVPFISTGGGGGSAPSEFGTIIAGDNIEVKNIGDDVKISAIVPDISNLATKEELEEKQPTGDYALASNIPTKVSQLENDSDFAKADTIPTLVSQLKNDLGFQTLADVMALLAQIPKFEKEVVDELPEVGERMTLYLVPNGEDGDDEYNEYIWIEHTSKYEFLGTTKIDLKDYVTKMELETVFNSLPKHSEPMTLAEYQNLDLAGKIDPDTFYYIKEG